MKRVTYKNTLTKLQEKNSATPATQTQQQLSWPVYNTQTKYFTINAECIKNSRKNTKWTATIAHKQIFITISNMSSILSKTK